MAVLENAGFAHHFRITSIGKMMTHHVFSVFSDSNPSDHEPFLGANHVQVTSRYLSFHRATQPVTAEVSQRVVHGSQENEPKQKKAVARTLRIRDTWVCLKI